jgi:hypothetical protein
MLARCIAAVMAAMAPAAPVQREAVPLIVMAVRALALLLLGLRCSAGDEGWEPVDVASALGDMLWLRLWLVLLVWARLVLRRTAIGLRLALRVRLVLVLAR